MMTWMENKLQSGCNKRTFEKLLKYQNGSARIDVGKLIKDILILTIKNQSRIQLKRQSGGENGLCTRCTEIKSLCIGQGQYGSVYKLDESTVIKFYDINTRFISERSTELIADLVLKSQQKQITMYTSFLVDKPTDVPGYPTSCKNPFQLLRYAEGGDLFKYNFDLLSKPTHDSITKLHNLILHILEALDWFSGNGLVHSDIKPDNILINGTKPLLHDFDLWFQVPEENPLTAKYYSFSPVYVSPILVAFIGRTQFTETSDANETQSHIIQHEPYESAQILPMYSQLHAILMKSMSTHFTRYMNTGSTIHTHDTQVTHYGHYGHYEEIVKMYTGKSFVDICTEIYKNDDLIRMNLLKSDYYSFGVVIFMIIYRLQEQLQGASIDEQAKSLWQSYIDNFLTHLMAMCISPFYSDVPAETTMSKGFRHGGFMLYTLEQWNIGTLQSDIVALQQKVKIQNNVLPLYNKLYTSNTSNTNIVGGSKRKSPRSHKGGMPPKLKPINVNTHPKKHEGSPIEVGDNMQEWKTKTVRPENLQKVFEELAEFATTTVK